MCLSHLIPILTLAVQRNSQSIRRCRFGEVPKMLKLIIAPRRMQEVIGTNQTDLPFLLTRPIEPLLTDQCQNELIIMVMQVHMITEVINKG